MVHSTGLWLIWIILQCSAVGGLAVLLLVALRQVLPESRGRVALAGLVAMSGLLVAGLLPGSGWFALPEVAENGPGLPADREPASSPTGSQPPTDEAADPPQVAEATPPELETEALAVQWQRISGWFVAEGEFPAVDDENDAAVAPVATSRHGTWLRWVLLGLAAVQVLAIARIAGGFWAVWRLRNRATICEDADAIATLGQLIKQSGIRRPVELMISSEVNTPAMLGWRRITILLPPEYIEWTSDQLQAVLAHELAHVARRDGLWRTIAALLQSLHFYNPLAHLLARRFVLEQELAADRLACQWLGQRETYLQSVANLALGRKAPEVGWSTLAFLPSRSTLVRRLEMLRYMPDAIPRPVERTLQAAALLVLFAATVAIGGLRPLGAQPPAEQPEAATEAQTTRRLAEFVPAELGHMVVEIEFAELMKSEEFAQMLAPPEEEDPLKPSSRKMLQEMMTILEPEDVQSVLIMQEVPGAQRSPMTLTFVQGSKVFDLQKLAGDSQEPAGQGPGILRIHPTQYLLAVSPYVFAHSSREADLAELAEFLKKPEDQRQSVADEVAKSDAVFRVSLDWSKVGPKLLEEPGFANSPIQVMVAPLTRPAKRWTFELRNVEESIEATLVGQFGTADQATRAQETLLGLRPLLKNLHEGSYAILEDPDAFQDALGGVKKLLDLGGQLLESAKVEVRESDAVVTAQGEGQLDLLMVVVMPALHASGMAADRMRDTNDMKQVALAFHNYADVHKHFPTPVIVDAESGQKRSWRVELLPYLEEQALYDQYRKDEPWDSEANLKVLEQMPAVYRSARQHDPTATSVYAVIGKDTALDGEKPSFRDVVDGTSNTVLYIHTQRDTPWTKPEDIPLEEATPDRLGGFYPEVFIVAMVDGSVPLIVSTIDPEVWKRLLIRNDGQPTPQLDPP